MEFEYDPRKAKVNRTKHGVEFNEAITVFDDAKAKFLSDPAHSSHEERGQGHRIFKKEQAAGGSFHRTRYAHSPHQRMEGDNE